MKLNKRIILISVAAIAVTSSIVFIVVKRKKNNASIKKINDILEEKIPDPANIQGEGNFWTPLYWKKESPKTYLITDKSTNDYLRSIAKQIYDGIGRIYDDPDSIKAAFNKLNSKLSISVVADIMNSVYSKDLYGWLETTLDRDYQKKIWNEIKTTAAQLPKSKDGQ